MAKAVWNHTAENDCTGVDGARVSNVSDKYKNGDYLAKNPDWHRTDSLWKATRVRDILKGGGVEPRSICEVGCGAGDVLMHMKEMYPDTMMTGYDISTDATQFWSEHEERGIEFCCGDFLERNQQKYDCILLIDLIEHLNDPHAFLGAVRESAKYFVFHFPLDLSVSTVFRERLLVDIREKVGHIHYFSKELAFALLRECGFEVMNWQYTNASLNAPDRSLKTRIAALPRRIAYAVNKDVGVRLLGGETLMVLARV